MRGDAVVPDVGGCCRLPTAAAICWVVGLGQVMILLALEIYWCVFGLACECVLVLCMCRWL